MPLAGDGWCLFSQRRMSTLSLLCFGTAPCIHEEASQQAFTLNTVLCCAAPSSSPVGWTLGYATTCTQRAVPLSHGTAPQTAAHVSQNRFVAADTYTPSADRATDILPGCRLRVHNACALCIVATLPRRLSNICAPSNTFCIALRGAFLRPWHKWGSSPGTDCEIRQQPHVTSAVLPTYVTQDYIRSQLASGGNVAATSTFARLTMGNVPRGSALFWCGQQRSASSSPPIVARQALDAVANLPPTLSIDAMLTVGVHAPAGCHSCMFTF